VVVRWPTAVPPAGTSRRTVMEWDTFGAGEAPTALSVVE
jgi:hypothetical protein